VQRVRKGGGSSPAKREKTGRYLRLSTRMATPWLMTCEAILRKSGADAFLLRNQLRPIERDGNSLALHGQDHPGTPACTGSVHLRPGVFHAIDVDSAAEVPEKPIRSISLRGECCYSITRGA